MILCKFLRNTGNSSEATIVVYQLKRYSYHINETYAKTARKKSVKYRQVLCQRISFIR